MVKIQKSDFVDNIFYVKKNEILVNSFELFDNFKPSNKKLIHKFKGENEFLIFFNIEQHARLFVKFLNEFNVSI